MELPTIRISEGNTEPGKTDKPTYLLAPEICEQHRNGYNFLYWFGLDQWRKMDREAKALGFIIPEPQLIQVTFRPVGWAPDIRYLEVDRG